MKTPLFQTIKLMQPPEIQFTEHRAQSATGNTTKAQKFDINIHNSKKTGAPQQQDQFHG